MHTDCIAGGVGKYRMGDAEVYAREDANIMILCGGWVVG